MARSETAKNASSMAGDKLYQKRARKALPLLVRQARAREPITYEHLAGQLDIPNPRNLNYPLGCVGISLQQLGDEWKQTIPQIQLLVVNKNTRLPGDGVIGFLKDAAALSVTDQLKRIKDAQSEVYAYQQWDDVLHALGLKKISPPVTREETLRCLATVSYDRDLRCVPDNRRRGQFVVGWNEATVRIRSQGYQARTLRSLTWRNLGFRCGQYFGKVPKEKIKEVWTVLVSSFERDHGADSVSLVEEVDPSSLVEGAITRVVVNAYERNASARAKCLEVHGTNCAVCNLNFGQRYGPLAENYIHVHHLRPLSEIGTSYTVDPEKDLRPVCPNCHAVIHIDRTKPPLALEEVRRMLAVRATIECA